MEFTTLALVLMILLIISFVLTHTRHGRMMFDVVVFLILLLILLGVAI